MLFRRTRAGARRAAVAVELAVLLPLLVFLAAVGVDFARAFYYSLTVTSAARNGALYGSQDTSHSTDTAGIKATALADATNLSPSPDVSSTTGTDAQSNPYVQVTVSWTFNTITNFPGVPGSVTLSRTVQMRVGPLVPKNVGS